MKTPISTTALMNGEEAAKKRKSRSKKDPKPGARDKSFNYRAEVSGDFENRKHHKPQ